MLVGPVNVCRGHGSFVGAVSALEGAVRVLLVSESACRGNESACRGRGSTCRSRESDFYNTVRALRVSVGS